MGAYVYSMLIGTHNTHDETGLPTPFAQVIFFTEAIPSEVREELEQDYHVYTTIWQRDLVIAVDRRCNWEFRRKRYRLAHRGYAKITPHRGTFWVIGILDGWMTVLVAEHRINASFHPFVRGEPILRPRLWRKHTDLTLGKVREWKARNWVVHAGGDLNTPNGVNGYEGALTERGKGYDRLGSTKRLGEAEYLSPVGSDHRRMRVKVL